VIQSADRLKPEHVAMQPKAVLLAPVAAEASAPRAGRAPPGCVWVRQMDYTLLGMEAFLDGKVGAITREFHLDAYLRCGDDVGIVCDASPWGLGAILLVAGVIISFFSVPLGHLDVAFFGHDLGDSSGQQTWEALVILVALRTWRSHWAKIRVKLCVKGDNVSALHLLANLRARGRGPSRIAREIALELCEGNFSPDTVSHLPGVANGLTDALGRQFQPSKPFAVPPCLQGVEQAQPAERTAAYFHSLRPPGSSS
jgi:hypothetical protein